MRTPRRKYKKKIVNNFKYNVTITRSLSNIDDVLAWLALEEWKQGIDWKEDVKHRTAVISFEDATKAFKCFCRWSSN